MRLTYLSHAEVGIDPAVAVTDWSLSELGRSRVEALARVWPAGPLRILCSPERKALQTAGILAARLKLRVEMHAEMGEVDRSATGYLPFARHEQLAERLFAQPDQSAEGWERAIDAQARVVAALRQELRDHSGDLLLVGHGAVGTFLWCALTGQSIARHHDQPRQGCFWQAALTAAGPQAVEPWDPMELLPAAPG